MKKVYEPLFTPWKIGNVEIPNRIVQTSMGGTSLFGWLEPCHFDKEAAHHILNRAQEHVGLVLPGMQCVRDTMGRRWLYQNKKMFQDLAEWMPEFHKTGSKLFIQLAGGFGRSMAINQMMVDMLEKKPFGAIAKPFLDIEYCCASASETPNRWYPSLNSRPLTVAEIQEMVEAFAKTAKMCKDAGVDGVEIHAVHEGYLLDQFTIANMNYRTDQYGGSFENRFRFPVEIVQAIKRECGEDFPVALRYSVVSKTKGWLQGAQPGEEFEEFGRDMEESEKAIKYLED
ncbi:MAG: 2-enoate reductase, partial [Clostridia bacterium]|nr:2-enoate reductase [Clostridia bacterium]